MHIISTHCRSHSAVTCDPKNSGENSGESMQFESMSCIRIYTCDDDPVWELNSQQRVAKVAMLVHVHRVSWGGFGGCKVNNISDMSKNEQKRVILARSARLTTTYSLATLLRLFRQVTSSARALLGCTPIHSQLSYIHIATQLIQIESAY